MAYGEIIAHRYWNTGGVAVAIVAVEGGADDVAAYIGGDPRPHAREDDTVQHVLYTGAKLTREEAMRFLPKLLTSSLVYRD